MVIITLIIIIIIIIIVVTYFTIIYYQLNNNIKVHRSGKLKATHFNTRERAKRVSASE